MTITRRTFVQGLLALGASHMALAADTGPLPIRVNIPGPGALPFLPIDPIPRLGLDRKLGVDLQIRYFASGVQAAEDMLEGNAHFAGFGFSVLPKFAAKGLDVAAIAPLSGSHTPYAIVARADLRGKVRTLADLRGRSIGASVGSVNSKTHMQMLTELLLRSAGVAPEQVRWVGTAQNLNGQVGALAGGVVDAVFCEEPFISALLRRKLGYVLADMTDPKVAARVPGSGHLRASIVASRATLAQDPARAERMVQMTAQALAWIHRQTPETIVAQLPLADDQDRNDYIAALRRSPRMHSRDVRFSQRKLVATREFLAALGNGAQIIDPATLIDSRWGGIRP